MINRVIIVHLRGRSSHALPVIIMAWCEAEDQEASYAYYLCDCHFLS